jgi:hypothetical protein
MITFINKEQLLHFMSKGAVKMSNQDAHFFQNLYGLITRKKQVTSNQVELFNKLVVKYKNQLKRRGIKIADLLDLTWKTSIIESEKKFTIPNIKLEDGTLFLRTPYKTKFVSEFNSIKYNPFEWSTGSRNFQAPISTYALKLAITIVNKHFDSLDLAPEVQEVISQCPQIEAKFWKPTLTKTNHYYIAASNKVINDLVKDIDLNDDPKTFYQLSKLGIDIDPQLIGDNKFAKFAAHHYNEVTEDQFLQVAEWMSMLGITTVFFPKERMTASPINALKSALLKYSIRVTPKTTDKEEMVLFLMHSYASKSFYTNVTKQLHFKNNTPIKI